MQELKETIDEESVDQDKHEAKNKGTPVKSELNKEFLLPKPPKTRNCELGIRDRPGKGWRSSIRELRPKPDPNDNPKCNNSITPQNLVGCEIPGIAL